MCDRCDWRGLSRRGFCRAVAVGAAALSPAAHALGTQADLPIEPGLRVADLPSGRRVVALTFDCCPGAFDERIAQSLIQQRIPATIFVTGLWLKWNPAGAALLRAHADLFAIENHGALHIPPVLGDRAIFGIRVAGDLPTIRREIAGGAAAVVAAIGVAPRWYRAATGFYTPSVIPEIRAMGFAIGGFSLSADLGASLPARRVAERMANARSGEVIVAHLNQPRRSSGAGVVEGLQRLQQQGTAFVRLDEVTTT